MIPIFPKFKKISITDKKQISEITSSYAPYSDFNFVSLWSYNTEGDILVSLLHGNLVLRLRDYITDELFYTFIGRNKLFETVTALFDISKKEHILPYLKLIPEENLMSSSQINKLFSIKEDRDNFDYVYFTKKLADLKGQMYSKKRGWFSHFKRNYPEAQVKLLNLTNQDIVAKILKTFSIWKENKNKNDAEIEHELTAIKLLLSKVKQLNLLSLGVFISNELVAFAIVEVFHKDYALYHFVKANVKHKGVYEFLYKSLAEVLYQNRSVYINREQDLGLPGLRVAKESWGPEFFLKKYIISPK